MKLVFLSLIKLYQLVLSPLNPPSCRFMPSCSEYAKEAIIIYGPLKGCRLALKRLLKCHPFGKSGFDPVLKQEFPKKPKQDKKN